jgi:hypothetical protein
MKIFSVNYGLPKTFSPIDIYLLIKARQLARQIRAQKFNDSI